MEREPEDEGRDGSNEEGGAGPVEREETGEQGRVGRGDRRGGQEERDDDEGE